MKANKRRLIVAAIFCLALVFLLAGLLFWDPTVRFDDADTRITRLIAQSIPEERGLVEMRSEASFPDKNPIWIRCHPRNWRRPQLGLSGTSDGSWAYLIETKEGRMRCYSHFFRGYTSAFTVLYSPRIEVAVERFAGDLRKEFRGLPVQLQKSDTLRLADPTR